MRPQTPTIAARAPRPWGAPQDYTLTFGLSLSQQNHIINNKFHFFRFNLDNQTNTTPFRPQTPNPNRCATSPTALGCAPEVEVQGAHDGEVDPVREGREDQPAPGDRIILYKIIPTNKIRNKIEQIKNHLNLILSPHSTIASQYSGTRESSPPIRQKKKPKPNSKIQYNEF